MPNYTLLDELGMQLQQPEIPVQYQQPLNQPTVEQAQLLQSIQNPPEANPLLQAITQSPDHAEGPSFGREIANMALGEVPLVGQILQKRHANEFAEQQAAGQREALANSVKDMHPTYQKFLGDLVQQGQSKAAFDEFRKLGDYKLKQQESGKDNAALQAALKDRIARIEDPILRRSLEALSINDPKSALIQTAGYENATISNGFRGRSEDRAKVAEQITHLEGIQKDLKGNDAGKQAVATRMALIDKGFNLDDMKLSNKKFGAKFGFKEQEAAVIKRKLQTHFDSKMEGGILGFGAALPEDLQKNPSKLLEGSENMFATPEAIQSHTESEAIKAKLQKQADELRGLDRQSVESNRERNRPKATIDRKTADGKIAVYDAETKKFLRYK